MMNQPAQTPKLTPPSTIEVPPETPVVTLQGACEQPQNRAKSGTCKTVITRAQMDALIDTLIPNAPQYMRSQFTVNYVRSLAAAAVARKRHLENNPAVMKEIETRQKMARSQALASSLYKSFEVDAAKVSQAEIQEYYSGHASEYEEGEVQRLAIPKSAAATGNPEDIAALKALADSLRARAVAGEDFDRLQQEAYQNLGIKDEPSTVKMGMERRISLPSDEAKVFDLKPGEISEVIDSPMALVILKLVSKKSAPLETVRPEIESLLQGQHMQQSLSDAARSVQVDFNLKYLEMASAPELFVPPPGAGQPSATRSATASNFHWRRPSRSRTAQAVVPAQR